jgi:hypothetical protein
MKISLTSFLKSRDLLSTPTKLICFDFDGVIHSYTSGWNGVAKLPDLPVVGSKAFLETLVLTKNVKVAIFSCRNRYLRGRRAMKKYLVEQVGLSPIIAKQIKFPWFKPAAVVFIDDRGFLFEGEFPSVETLLNFKPWIQAGSLLNPFNLVERLTKKDVTCGMTVTSKLVNDFSESLN